MEIDDAGDDTRHRIVTAAARLLTDGGPDAVSTRAVGAAAGVQAPTIYRLFGDKQGLLDAVASHGFSTYLASKAGVEPTGDPVEDLRAGWVQMYEKKKKREKIDFQARFHPIHPLEIRSEHIFGLHTKSSTT